MTTSTTHDVLAVGLGPFNLGLAALADPVQGLDAVFLEARGEFSWHPGLMIDGAHLQTPFMSDLVTLADPTSRFSFLSYLKQVGRLYPFYIRENFYPLREEFDDYCRWVSLQVRGIRFGRRVESVEWDDDGEVYVATAVTSEGERESYAARSLVLGTGTPPHVPDACTGLPADLHASTYLARRDELRRSRRVTVVGSGQSAAEVYQDLLGGIDEHGYELVWATRSPRFFPLEYTKLTLEMTSPEYVDHVHALPEPLRGDLVRSQAQLYKGISADLVDAIFDELYARRVGWARRGQAVPTRLLTTTEVVGARREDDGSYALRLRQTELGEEFDLATDGLVLATGYRYRTPAFLAPVADRIRWDAAGRYDVTRDYRIDTGDGGAGSIFVQNAELHTHGLSSPDLGMAAHRNSWILRGLTGREVYSVETRIAVQEFGIPSDGLESLDGVRGRRDLAGASR